MVGEARAPEETEEAEPEAVAGASDPEALEPETSESEAKEDEGSPTNDEETEEK